MNAELEALILAYDSLLALVPFSLVGSGFFIQISPGQCLLFEHVSDTSQNDLAWCERLYDAKARELILYGRALGLSHGEAEDVLQETFLALMKRIAPPQKPDHYCLRSFRNRALNYKRSLWRRLTRELESTRWFERSEDETPAESAAMRCLARLPAEQREVIVLKIWHQYTFEHIGELLDLSLNTAAGRYRYGLQKLTAHLRGGDYERFESLGESLALLDPASPVKSA
jgi:RNA polymerase sigma-70 factor (ECF subfamily)